MLRPLQRSCCLNVIDDEERVAGCIVRKIGQDFCSEGEQRKIDLLRLLLLVVSVRIAHVEKPQKIREETLLLLLGIPNRFLEDTGEDAFVRCGPLGNVRNARSDFLVRVHNSLVQKCVLHSSTDTLTEHIGPLLAFVGKEFQGQRSDIGGIDVALQPEQIGNRLERIQESLTKKMRQEINTCVSNAIILVLGHLIKSWRMLC
mmetsp:Transcript_8301/g.13746  ORF Transcript_8301/g.13746 Transcript_8301/m.13746 type:complete len:202 (-) Transcript_8301:256-861(-)